MKPFNTNGPEVRVAVSRMTPEAIVTVGNATTASRQSGFTLHRPNSQTGRLQRFLLNHPNVWHRMTDLMAATRSNVVHSKVDTLRDGGMQIANRLEHFQSNGEQITVSYYMYIPAVGVTAATQPVQQPHTTSQTTEEN